MHAWTVSLLDQSVLLSVLPCFLSFWETGQGCNLLGRCPTAIHLGLPAASLSCSRAP